MNHEFIITKIERVILVGKDEYQERNSTFGSNLRFNELIFHLSGKVTVRFNGKTMNCEKDVIRFLPKGDNHEYTVEREEQGDCIDVFFDTDIPISNEAFILKPKNRVTVANLFKIIFSVWVSKNEGYYFRCLSLLYEILSEIQKTNYIPENQYNAIKPAIGYINENFLNLKISMDFLANLCSVSRSYLKKLFIKKFGVPPSKYIIQLKINYACDLLRSELYTVTQTADLCGYNDVYFFSRQFKEYIGVSPTDFLKKYRSSK